jgi:hypothetical protein
MSEERITPNAIREQNLNANPDTKEELQNMMITPQDGRSPVTSDLKKFYNVEHEEDTRSGWEMKTALSSDTRMSNTNELEKKYINWTIRGEAQCLMLGLSKAGLYYSWLRSSINEPSLGFEGFLRKNIQSVNMKNETISTEEKVPKRSIFGFMKGD